METVANTKDLPDAWTIAKNRFLDALDDKERALFNEATLENLYYTASNVEREDRQKSKTRSSTRKLQPLVSAIESYGKALDAFSNMAPSYLAPIWGSIRVILVITQSYGKFYDKIIDTFSRIGDLLPQFRDYERLFDRQKHQRLVEAISNTYLDIILLCTEFRALIHELSKSSLKRVFKPLSFDTTLDDAIDRFRQHKFLVKEEANICHMIEAAEARAIILANKELEEFNQKAKRRAQLLAKLSAMNGTNKHDTLRKVRHETTGAWVFDRQEYRVWLECDKSAVLFLYGIPGCGKSVLMSTIIDALPKATQNFGVAYYYCDYADKRTLDPVNLWSSLAYCLLQNIEIPSSIESMIDQYYGKGEHIDRLPQTSDALQIVTSLIEEQYDLVILVIDGLDEIKENDRQEIIQCLRRLLEVIKTVKLLVSSRDDDILIVSSAEVNQKRLKMLPDTINSDIVAFVKHSVNDLLASSRLVLRDPLLEQIIVNVLSDGAKGMFLWVKFQLEELCTAESDVEIKRILENLPKDLSETYDRLLSRIVGQQREELVRRMFKWIICAKRPLSLEELREAIAFTVEDCFWDAGKIPTDMLRLVRACGNLILVSEDTGTVQLAHYTVQQYLLKEATLGPSMQFSLREAQITVGEVCIAYLCFSDFETQVTRHTDTTNGDMAAIERIVTTQPLTTDAHFINSAVKVWNYFRGTQSRPSNIRYDQHIAKRKLPTKNLLQKYQMLSYIVENWLLHSSNLPENIGNETKIYTLFHGLIFRKELPFDIIPWTIPHFQSDHEIIQIARFGWTLQANHVLFFRVLIDTYPEFQPIAHLQVAKKQLLEADSSVDPLHLSQKKLEQISSFRDVCPENLKDAQLWLYSRVLVACRQGHSEILAKFLSLFKRFKQGSIYGIWGFELLEVHILLESAMYGHEEIVEMIVRQVPHMFTLEYQNMPFNAIELAAIRGHANVVRLLRRQKTYIHSLTRPREQGQMFGIVVLIEAARDGNEAVVEALLEILRDPIFEEISVAKGKLDALDAAWRNGHVSIIRMLFKDGTDILRIVTQALKDINSEGVAPFCDQIWAAFEPAEASKIFEGLLSAAYLFRNVDAGATGAIVDPKGNRVRDISSYDMQEFQSGARRALKLAIAQDKHDIVRKLVDIILGRELDSPWGIADTQAAREIESPIKIATLCSNTAITELLLSAGAKQ